MRLSYALIYIDYLMVCPRQHAFTTVLLPRAGGLSHFHDSISALVQNYLAATARVCYSWGGHLKEHYYLYMYMYMGVALYYEE